jgi:hypothetical protein
LPPPPLSMLSFRRLFSPLFSLFSLICRCASGAIAAIARGAMARRRGAVRERAEERALHQAARSRCAQPMQRGCARYAIYWLIFHCFHFASFSSITHFTLQMRVSTFFLFFAIYHYCFTTPDHAISMIARHYYYGDASYLIHTPYLITSLPPISLISCSADMR